MSADSKFNLWMQQIDRILESKTGFGSDDLADQPYRDWFDSGLTPKQAVEEILEREGIDFA